MIWRAAVGFVAVSNFVFGFYFGRHTEKRVINILTLGIFLVGLVGTAIIHAYYPA
jgi:hypothetical protein